MTIDFKNLILGRHESKVLFMWNPENGVMLGAFLGIKDGIETILAREGTTAAQRAILEELRAVADKSDWDFTALRKSLSGSHETRCCRDLCPPL
jgi:hypothetical protein